MIFGLSFYTLCQRMAYVCPAVQCSNGMVACVMYVADMYMCSFRFPHSFSGSVFPVHASAAVRQSKQAKKARELEEHIDNESETQTGSRFE